MGPSDPSMAADEGTRRASHIVIAVLLVIKAAVLVYNVDTFSTRGQYDARHHAWRARSAGLEVGRMAYNSPLYYLPVLPWVDLSRFYEDGEPRAKPLPGPDDRWKLLERLQSLNVGYVLGALLVWIYGILPMIVSSHRAWFLASLLLVAMPGYPKIAVMAHPDVLLLFLASLTFFVTIRWLRGPMRFRRHLALAVLAGLTGACRPLAVVPMLLFWAMNAGTLLRDGVTAIRVSATSKAAAFSRLGAKLAVVTLVTASLSAGWWAYRYAQTGEVLDAYDHRYVDPYQPLKEDFDYVHYYSSFYFGKLLDVPSRADVPIGPGTNPKGNSFWTQLYSDFWGDHFLYFSGKKHGVEQKLWVKRILFVVALPLSILLALGIVTGTIRALREAIRRRDPLDPTLFMAAAFWGGFLLFVYWQGTAGLLPGKNSSIKFLYIAWAVPFGVGTAASQRIGSGLYWIGVALTVAAACVGLPVSLHWP